MHRPLLARRAGVEIDPPDGIAQPHCDAGWGGQHNPRREQRFSRKRHPAGRSTSFLISLSSLIKTIDLTVARLGLESIDRRLVKGGRVACRYPGALVCRIRLFPIPASRRIEESSVVKTLCGEEK
jgi:hypothetical protein